MTPEIVLFSSPALPLDLLHQDAQTNIQTAPVRAEPVMEENDETYKIFVMEENDETCKIFAIVIVA